MLRALLSRSATVMASRLAGAGIGFLTQFLLVRLMGAEQLGLFYAGSSLAAVLGVIAAQGYPLIAARFIGRYRNKQDAALAGSFTGQALRDGLLAALLAATAVTLWAWLWPGLGTPARVTYATGGWMVMAIVVLNISTNIAGGMRRFALCYMPEGMLRPFVFFGLVAAAGLAGISFGAPATMLGFAAITVTLALAVSALLAPSLPRLRWRQTARTALAWRWRREAWALILLSIFTNFFADVGILAAVPFLSSSDVAVFGLCLKLALLIGYFVQIGQQMVVPDMADARHAGDTSRLRHAAWRAIVLPSALTLSALAVIALFGRPLLGIFGPEFSAGRDPLLILLAAQLLRGLAGPSAHLLTLSGVQSVNLMLAVTSLLTLFGASAVLTPSFGIEGAAGAVLIAYCYWIGASALALQWLREPPVDIFTLALQRR